MLAAGVIDVMLLNTSKQQDVIDSPQREDVSTTTWSQSHAGVDINSTRRLQVVGQVLYSMRYSHVLVNRTSPRSSASHHHHPSQTEKALTIMKLVQAQNLLNRLKTRPDDKGSLNTSSSQHSSKGKPDNPAEGKQ